MAFQKYERRPRVKDRTDKVPYVRVYGQLFQIPRSTLIALGDPALPTRADLYYDHDTGKIACVLGPDGALSTCVIGWEGRHEAQVNTAVFNKKVGINGWIISGSYVVEITEVDGQKAIVFQPELRDALNGLVRIKNVTQSLPDQTKVVDTLNPM